MADKDRERIYAACTRFVSGHYPQSPQNVLAELSAYAGPDVRADMYGAGELIESFEAEVAALLGHPAAVFMPSGTMAQQIALRIWTDRSGRRAVGFHPTCHLEIHEQQAYRVLHGLQGVLVGHRHRLMTLDDLKALHQPLGALLIELPQREIGGVLPEWDELVAMTDWARAQGIVLHMDGARLWECQPYYGRSYAEIGGLFDSVYVSFYKILGGIAGAVLAGPEDLIAEARVWQRRHGGNLVRLFPFVLSAKKGLAERLDRMGAYHAKAREMAAALGALPGVRVTPDPPQTNMMRVYLPGDGERLKQAALDVAEETGVWLTRGLAPSEVPGYHAVELSVGDAALDIPTEEIAALFADWLGRAATA